MNTKHTDKLLKKTFGVNSFNDVTKLLESKSESFYKSTFFTEKERFIKNIKHLSSLIERGGEDYSMALEASRSGSIIESFASVGLGDIKVDYTKNRKNLVHHLSYFYKKKNK